MNSPISTVTFFTPKLEVNGEKNSQSTQFKDLNEKVCAICYDNFEAQNESQKLAQTSCCKNIFHDRCFKKWASSDTSKEHGHRCPMCNTPGDYSKLNKKMTTSKDFKDILVMSLVTTTIVQIGLYMLQPSATNSYFEAFTYSVANAALKTISNIGQILIAFSGAGAWVSSL